MNRETTEWDGQLLTAAEAGDLDEVQNLLDRGAAIHMEDAFRHDALYHAAFNSHFDVVELLLERGAANRDRALSAAAFRGNIEIVRLLLDYGANPNVFFNPDGDVATIGDTALIAAASQGYTQAVALLLERGANPDSRDASKNCVLTRAARGYNRAGLVRFLLAQGIGSRWEDCTIALQGAILYNDPEVLQTLLDAGASLSGERGVQMVLDSLYFGQPRSFQFLLDHGITLTPQEAVLALENACEQDRDFGTRSAECLSLLQERILLPLLALPPPPDIVHAIRRIAEQERLDDLARIALAVEAGLESAL